jgi:hypothetical protein
MAGLPLRALQAFGCFPFRQKVSFTIEDGMEEIGPYSAFQIYSYRLQQGDMASNGTSLVYCRACDPFCSQINHLGIQTSLNVVHSCNMYEMTLIVETLVGAA